MDSSPRCPRCPLARSLDPGQGRRRAEPGRAPSAEHAGDQAAGHGEHHGKDDDVEGDRRGQVHDGPVRCGGRVTEAPRPAASATTAEAATADATTTAAPAAEAATTAERAGAARRGRAGGWAYVRGQRRRHVLDDLRAEEAEPGAHRAAADPP